MSIIRSKTISVTSVETTLALLFFGLLILQKPSEGSHVALTYGYWVSPADEVQINTHYCDTWYLMVSEHVSSCRIWKRDSPWMRNATLVNHVAIAIVIMILFLSQMATLTPMMSVSIQRGNRDAWKTYVRNRINNEELA
jgi:hypothetical protein